MFNISASYKNASSAGHKTRLSENNADLDPFDFVGYGPDPNTDPSLDYTGTMFFPVYDSENLYKLKLTTYQWEFFKIQHKLSFRLELKYIY